MLSGYEIVPELVMPTVTQAARVHEMVSAKGTPQNETGPFGWTLLDKLYTLITCTPM